MTPAAPAAGGRAAELAEALGGLGLGAALVVAGSARDPDLAAFVGRAHLGTAFLLVPAGGEARLGYLTAMERREVAGTGIAPLGPAELGVDRLEREHGGGPGFWARLLERAFAICEIEPCRVALAGSFPAGILHEACLELEGRGWRFVAGEKLLRRSRRRKTMRELGEARAAAQGVGAAFHRIAALLAEAEPADGRLLLAGERLTAGHLRRAAAEVFAAHGLEQPEGNIVACGSEAAVPHSQGDSARALAPGEPIVVDLFPRSGIFADCTRSFCRGEPPQAVAEAHAAVERALRRARREAVAGAAAWELQTAICALFAEAGYPTPIDTPGTTVGYVHGLGHGVGHELHELPSFRRAAGEDGRLAVGDLFTLEPGLYDADRGFGIRLEDLCHLGPDGLEVLTPLPCDLDPRAWAA